jgi:hypothetical protein
MKSVYEYYWDKFYKKKIATGKIPLWDVEPDESAALDFSFMKPYLSEGIGLLDIGCGYGKEAHWFAQHFNRVIAMDVSPTAINSAKAALSHPNLAFGVANWSAQDEGKRVRSKYGPLNVYIRAFLHQLSPEDQTASFKNLRDVTSRSTAITCITEVAPEIRQYVESSGGFKAMPRDLQEVFISHLPPKGVSANRMSELATEVGMEIISLEATSLQTRLKFKNGDRIKIPATRAIIRSAQTDSDFPC